MSDEDTFLTSSGLPLDLEFGLSETHKTHKSQNRKTQIVYQKSNQHRKDYAESKFDVAQPVLDDIQTQLQDSENVK